VSSPTLVRHFPNGHREYRYGEEALPEVGQTLESFGRVWRVVDVRISDHGHIDVRLAVIERSFGRVVAARLRRPRGRRRSTL
jgi:hypothetical protein